MQQDPSPERAIIGRDNPISCTGSAPGIGVSSPVRSTCNSSDSGRSSCVSKAPADLSYTTPNKSPTAAVQGPAGPDRSSSTSAGSKAASNGSGSMRSAGRSDYSANAATTFIRVDKDGVRTRIRKVDPRSGPNLLSLWKA